MADPQTPPAPGPPYHIDSVAAQRDVYIGSTVNIYPPGATGVPYLVPPIPPQGVVGRDQALDEIADLLALGNPAARDVSPVALRGMGGIGKTTLAIATGRRAEIPTRFPQGVLWTALGPEPTVRILLNDWGRALGLDLLPERDEAACSERLRAALFERRMLLIVDDVWDAEQGRAFLVGGPDCRTLLTTREPGVGFALATAPRTLRVDVLTPDAALDLLGRLAPQAVSTDGDAARHLCARLEFLPLALNLAGRLLANEGIITGRMRRLVDELLEQREARLHLLQQEGRLGLQEHEAVSLQAILGMSVDRLNSGDKERFAMLGTFGGEPLTWEVNAVTAVWDCSLPDAEETLTRFIQRGLVEPRPGDRYWMHALLADYAEELLDTLGL